MNNPTFLEYFGLITVSLLFAFLGLYFLINFSRIFRRTIKNAWLRRNAVAWLIIFCIAIAMIPMSGGFFYTLQRFGLGWAIGSHMISATLCTLIVFNSTRAVAENKKLKNLSFLKHKLLVLLTMIVTALAVSTPLTFLLYDGEKRFITYSVISNLYVTAATGIVYAMISYLDIERQRKIDEKELELSRLRELKTKAELDALHSKINPHFLYNALNSIADLAVTDGKKGRQMTIALADLFRYSINYSNNNYSSIRDEVEMANVYLQIEKIRFEDQLSYTLGVAEELNYFLVPRFVLQPLVENAVKHGLKATGLMTQIELRAKSTDNGFVITISDNGPAFPVELVPGYGVKSVYDKLDLLFPGNYEMHFSNLPVKQVSLYIHKLMKDEPGI